MNTYLLFKSLHLISVISWMAGLLYLPRIFVYHSQNSSKPIMTEVFKVMEKKLFFYIMSPAMILSWLFGLLLIHEIGLDQLGQKWMILKLIFVVILTFYHFYLGRILGQFKLDLNKHSHKYYRLINEIPTLLLIFIIFVVIFKPI
ncbi:MAG: protoporphyrinogen oxidase HemJ [Candidatus Pelagibacter sp. TMED239]|nr:MAG: protoporphyrinogen oxidase HemJ [Candidatus Pelagibacter sp. TMED239]